ncbi:hypothetical protein GHJ48_11630 [Acinetobacter sp. dk771]|uniref:Uncharacterized protein n=1 Tax=Acinetobacter wanghuae TaxID=2662362 RepID=A0AA91AGF0_9GAMM|nr:hypothetical protein [Acinetobacter wanghuae]MQW93031.1 hypothetical protein [Acinetobacter wanghuae]
MESIGFPSQGELLKFFYNATGIIPTKGEDILDITIKPKSLHKGLTRLAEEKGCNFLENFNQYSEEIFSSLSSLVVEDKFKEIIVNPIVNLFRGYLRITFREHTFLDKKQNIENLIERFIVDIARICFPSEIYYKYLLDDSYPEAPDLLSWLKNSEETPLAHAMTWIYSSEKMSYQIFHQLDDVDQTDKDLNNVKNWLTGKVQLPSTSQILSTFHRAFKKQKVNTKLADTYTFFLLIARFLTYCSNMLLSTYGDSFRTRYISLFIQAYSAVKRDFFILFGELLLKDLNSMSLEEKEFFLTELFIANEEICHKNLLEMQKNFTTRQLLELWIPKDRPYHSATVHIHRYLGLTGKAEKTMKPLEVNIENMIHAYKIIKGSESNYEVWLAQYNKVNNNVLCPWLKNWVDAILLFKQKEYSQALEKMRNAFETIRYTAADKMIEFLESYMIISLLIEDKGGWKDFKRAFKWGVFMNNFGDLKPFYVISEETEIRSIFEDKLTVISSFENIRDLKTLAKLVFHFPYSST